MKYIYIYKPPKKALCLYIYKNIYKNLEKFKPFSLLCVAKSQGFKKILQIGVPIAVAVCYFAVFHPEMALKGLTQLELESPDPDLVTVERLWATVRPKQHTKLLKLLGHTAAATQSHPWDKSVHTSTGDQYNHFRGYILVHEHGRMVHHSLCSHWWSLSRHSVNSAAISKLPETDRHWVREVFSEFVDRVLSTYSTLASAREVPSNCALCSTQW